MAPKLNNADLLRKAEKERESTKVTLTWLEQIFNDHATTPIPEGKIDHYIMTTKTTLAKIEDTFGRIHSLVDVADLDPHSNEYTSLLNRAIELQYQFGVIQKKASAAIPHSTSSTSTPSNDLRLPKLSLPFFEGNPTEWISFRDMFQTAVHNNKGLNKVQKLTYLKSQVRGEAARQIQSISITEANYDIAWSLLTDRYQNDREIFFAIMRRFHNQPNVQPHSAVAIRQLVDVSRESTRSLENLKLPIHHWDAHILFIIVSKMDQASKELWEQTLKDSSIPTLKSLYEFLEQRARALSASGVSASRPVTRPFVNPSGFNKPSNNYVRNDFKNISHHTSSLPNCKYCNDSNHPLFKCSKFQGWSVQERSDAIKQAKVCFNCLQEGHRVIQCTSTKTCKTCHGKHHTLLHRPKSTEGSVSINSHNESKSLTHFTANDPIGPMPNKFDTLLATALVKITGKDGQQHIKRVLVDNASNTNYVTESTIRSLGISKRKCISSATGLGELPVAKSSGVTSFSVSPHFKNDQNVFNVPRCLIVDKITSMLPTAPFDHTNWSHLQNLQLADPKYHIPQEVDMLLGADFFFTIVESGKINGPPNSPKAINSSFGWLIGGGSADVPFVSPHVHATLINNLSATSDQEETLDTHLLRFWEIESTPTERLQTQEEVAAESHFTSNYKRDKEGRIQVKIPFKITPPNIGMSQKIAINRLNYLERRLRQKPDYEKDYKLFMREYEDLGHMTEVEAVDSPNVCYIPHHFVLKESSSTTKFRVVFDASAKTSNGVSLNSTMMVGPTIQDSLFDIMLRFRLHKIAFTADIAKMYRQVKVDPDDANFQRIVWRDDQTKPIKHYQLNTVTYGTAAGAFLATRALQELAKLESDSFPLASEVAKRDFYVDDLISGEATIQDALHIQSQLIGLTQAGAMKLRQWSSNSKELLEAIPPDMRETKSLLSFDIDATVKTLGISWNPHNDQFVFKVIPQSESTPPKALTKRSILSEIAKLFDPIGWVAPVIVNAKVFMQSLWKLKQGWDEILPDSIQQQWISFKKNLEELNLLSINRYCLAGTNLNSPSLNSTTASSTTFELIGFCDASEIAYAACVYLFAYDNQYKSVTLVTSKTRVAPIKQVSLPRLELMGAEILSELISSTKSALRIPIHSVSAYTDSTVALSWIQSHPSRWKTFIANRVTKIQENISPENWYHVPGTDNPADCASRGISTQELIHHPLWWNGPSWLLDKPTLSPNPCLNREERTHMESEAKPIKICHFTTTDESESLLNRYSSLIKLYRVTAFMFRFIKNSRIKGFNSSRKKVDIKSALIPPLAIYELRQAEEYWITLTQQQVFQPELRALRKLLPMPKCSKLCSLSVFLDSSGLIRVGGRLKKSNIPIDQKHPIVLPNRSPLTKLIIKQMHLNHFHAGPQLLLSVVQSRFWIIRAKDVIRHFVHSCVTCTRFKAQTLQQVMADLPSFRVQPTRAFLKCGVDYAGPFLIKPILPRSKTTHKAYFAIFICCATKAVHLEVVSTLSTDGFMAALRRFIARRGKPVEIHSDCGTNFVGANNEMQDFLKLFKSSQHNNQVSDNLSQQGISWMFNPPASPHFGGLWEAGVKSVKYHLRTIMGSHRLTFEELSTATAQIEAILNSRPITPISTDPDDLSALTPGHFLIGAPLTSVPEPDLLEIKTNRLSRWEFLQQMTQAFWKRWSNEYLTRLQQRPKWMTTKAEIKVNDLVLIKEENLPPLQWKLGRVQILHPGSDSITRVVTLKTQTGLIKRPIVKLCLLPIDNNDSFDLIKDTL
jgi:hypothetical protein